MKTFTILWIVAVATVLGLAAAPAEAGKNRSSGRGKKPLVATPAARRPIAYGESFDLRPSRKALPPSGDATPVVALCGLSQVQVGQVVKDRAADLEYCWNRVPGALRAETTAVLKLSIEMTGEVSGIAVGGGVPSEAESCIALAAGRWTFPVAAVASDVEYPVSLK